MTVSIIADGPIFIICCDASEVKTCTSEHLVQLVLICDEDDAIFAPFAFCVISIGTLNTAFIPR